MARLNYFIDYRFFIFTLIVYETEFNLGYLSLLLLTLSSLFVSYFYYCSF